jgi:outer membrane protein assembly factor BamB
VSTPEITSLYVVGGRQRELRPMRAGQQPWQGYDLGLVVHVDLETGTLSPRLEYSSQPGVNSGPEAAISLQASTLVGDLLYTCTETEVLVYKVPAFELLHYVSLPWFNDVHHVTPSPDGNLIVANAGLEMVLELTPAGDVVRTWNVLGEDPWAAFDPGRDYRQTSTKPHRGHPNYVFYIGDELWATRFHQGDAISLTRPGRKIHVSDRRIHDGLVHNGLIYFTTVDGTLVVVDAETLETVQSVELPSFHDERMLLGWCRGILVDGDRVWVGFSRIRPTRFRENVSWVARGFQRDRGTHLGCYDLVRGTFVTEIDLEPAGLAALYSVLRAP